MLGWPQEAGFAFSSKNIQPLTSLDVLYSNSWSPSLLQAAASLFLSTELSPEQTQPGSSACPETLLLLWQNFPPSGMQFNPAAGKAHTVVAPGLSCYRIPPWLPVLPGGTPALQRMDRAAHSIPTAPGALEELTTASRKLSWELKGYTTGSSAQVQTVSSFLFSKKRRNHSSHPALTSGHYSHLAAAQGSSAALSPAKGSLFQHHAPHVSLPCFPAEKGHGSLQAPAQIP